ncbi:MAG: phosphate propanoyltransferase [Candidatus Latescibacterota bacterium]|nr:phosphate propanoyltransferase [Candidatus Latescibacterota bacterium]
MTTVSRAAVEQMVRAALLRHRPGGSMRGQGSARLIANISARHCHLDDGTLKILFGSDAKLTVMKPLYQAGAFASDQTVTIFGPRKQMISNLRVLGPLRDAPQVELAFSDARFLGIDAPVRISGNTAGSPGCFLVGPHGGVEIPEGVIRAARHVHMSPDEAQAHGVGEGDRMRLVVEGEQGGVLDDVVVRITPESKLEVHLDTDEGNAVDLVNAREVTLSTY